MIAKGLIKKQTGMNGTESRYAQILVLRRSAGEVLWFGFESIKLKLADNTFYTPDFAVQLANGEMEFHETKGFWRDDARVKFKVAADMYPFRFVAIKETGKKGVFETIETLN